MKKRSFPKSITILGREFKIVVKNDVVHDGKRVGGTCDFHNKEIEVAETIYPNEKFTILVHESTHAFLEITGINQRLTDKEEETYCQLIAAFVEDIVKAFK